MPTAIRAICGCLISYMSEQAEKYWFARHSTSIIFLIIVLAIVGIYEAFQIPVAVFPTTNFPLIKIGVDNGVMPIEQMEVTITRPIEQAVNIVPGREYDPDAADGQRRSLAYSKQSALDSEDRNLPHGFFQLSDHRLQPYVG